jgi:hypothetical protein
VPVSTAAGNPCSAAIAGAHAIVVPCPPDQRDRPHNHPGRRGQAKQRRAKRSDDVLQEDENRCQHAQDGQRSSTGKQIGQTGIDADRCEENDQQPVAGDHLEVDCQASCGIKNPHGNCRKKSTGHRLRDVVFAQKRDPLCHNHADEIDEQTDRKRQEIRYDKRVRRWCHHVSLLSERRLAI